jgi:hypothetical protein
VRYLSRALIEHYRDRQRERHRPLLGALPAPGLEGRALLVVVHLADAPFPDTGRLRPEGCRRPSSTTWSTSQAASTMRSLAENYVGLPFEGLSGL